jgi:sRNA-binding carbon storage regulator CsrA
MLKLTRKVGEAVLLHMPVGNAEDITARVLMLGIDAGGIFKVGIEAPHAVTIIRPEVNDPERGSRAEVPEDKLIKDLFHECWRQGHGILPYEKGKWMELQALLQARGIVL